MKSLITSIRITIITLFICSGLYTATLLAFAQAVTPGTATGSLIKNKNGDVVGSHLIAQKFTQAQYFWPRPSAVDYNGAGAGGSNKSPTSPDLTDRAKTLIDSYGASEENRLPAELAAASGGGLDPHITEHAAMYQAKRVAEARSLSQTDVETIIQKHVFAPGGFFSSERLVNVLELNLALDSNTL